MPVNALRSLKVGFIDSLKIYQFIFRSRFCGFFVMSLVEYVFTDGLSLTINFLRYIMCIRNLLAVL